MNVELHDEVEHLLAEWETLFKRDVEATPFVAPSWMAAWWEHWGDGARPWVLGVRERGRLIGLAPFVLTRRGPLRLLRGMGEGPGDYWGPLAVPERREAVLAGVAEELTRRRRQWDAIVVKRLPAENALQSALLASPLRVQRLAPMPCPAIDLPSSFAGYLDAMPKSRRGNLRRHLRRLDEGELTLREVHGAEELKDSIERWQRLRVSQWKSMGKDLDPEHGSDRFRAFMLDAVQALVPQGLALVWEFVRQEEVVAVYVNFADRRSFYWYLGGFTPEVLKLGVGKIAVGEGIRSSIALGRTRYDFMRGSEPYKYWFGAEDLQSPNLIFYTGRPRSRAGVGVANAARRLRLRADAAVEARAE